MSDSTELSPGQITCLALTDILKRTEIKLYFMYNGKWARVLALKKDHSHFVLVCYETANTIAKWDYFPWPMQFSLFLGTP